MLPKLLRVSSVLALERAGTRAANGRVGLHLLRGCGSDPGPSSNTPLLRRGVALIVDGAVVTSGDCDFSLGISTSKPSGSTASSSSQQHSLSFSAEVVKANSAEVIEAKETSAPVFVSRSASKPYVDPAEVSTSASVPKSSFSCAPREPAQHALLEPILLLCSLGSSGNSLASSSQAWAWGRCTKLALPTFGAENRRETGNAGFQAGAGSRSGGRKSATSQILHSSQAALSTGSGAADVSGGKGRRGCAYLGDACKCSAAGFSARRAAPASSGSQLLQHISDQASP